MQNLIKNNNILDHTDYVSSHREEHKALTIIPNFINSTSAWLEVLVSLQTPHSHLILILKTLPRQPCQTSSPISTAEACSCVSHTD